MVMRVNSKKVDISTHSSGEIRVTITDPSFFELGDPLATPISAEVWKEIGLYWLMDQLNPEALKIVKVILEEKGVS